MVKGTDTKVSLRKAGAESIMKSIAQPRITPFPGKMEIGNPEAIAGPFAGKQSRFEIMGAKPLEIARFFTPRAYPLSDELNTLRDAQQINVDTAVDDGRIVDPKSVDIESKNLADLKADLEAGKPVGFEDIMAAPEFPQLDAQAARAMEAEWYAPGGLDPDKDAPLRISEADMKDPDKLAAYKEKLIKKQTSLIEFLENKISDPDFKTRLAEIPEGGSITFAKTKNIQSLSRGPDLAGEFMEASRGKKGKSRAAQLRRADAGDPGILSVGTSRGRQVLFPDNDMDLPVLRRMEDRIAAAEKGIQPLSEAELKKLKAKRSQLKKFKGKIRLAKGFIPNFISIPGVQMEASANSILQEQPEFLAATMDAVRAEASFGVQPKVVSAPQFASAVNPGLAVVTANDTVERGTLSGARMAHGGTLDPTRRVTAGSVAAAGLIPNFAQREEGEKKFARTVKANIPNFASLQGPIIADVKGDASFMDKGGDAIQDAKAGHTLDPASEITTGADGEVTLLWSDGTVSKVGPATENHRVLYKAQELQLKNHQRKLPFPLAHSVYMLDGVTVTSGEVGMESFEKAELKMRYEEQEERYRSDPSLLEKYAPRYKKVDGRVVPTTIGDFPTSPAQMDSARKSRPMLYSKKGDVTFGEGKSFEKGDEIPWGTEATINWSQSEDPMVTPSAGEAKLLFPDGSIETYYPDGPVTIEINEEKVRERAIKMGRAPDGREYMGRGAKEIEREILMRDDIRFDGRSFLQDLNIGDDLVVDVKPLRSRVAWWAWYDEPERKKNPKYDPTGPKWKRIRGDIGDKPNPGDFVKNENRTVKWHESERDYEIRVINAKNEAIQKYNWAQQEMHNRRIRAASGRRHIDDMGPMSGTHGYMAEQANKEAALSGLPMPYRFEQGQAVMNDNSHPAAKALMTTITAPARIVLDTGGLISSTAGWIGEGGIGGVVDRLIEGEENWFTGDDNVAYQAGRKLHEISSDTIAETATGGKGAFALLAFATDVAVPVGGLSKTKKGADLVQKTTRATTNILEEAPTAIAAIPQKATQIGAKVDEVVHSKFVDVTAGRKYTTKSGDRLNPKDYITTGKNTARQKTHALSERAVIRDGRREIAGKTATVLGNTIKGYGGFLADIATAGAYSATKVGVNMAKKGGVVRKRDILSAGAGMTMDAAGMKIMMDQWRKEGQINDEYGFLDYLSDNPVQVMSDIGSEFLLDAVDYANPVTFAQDMLMLIENHDEVWKAISEDVPTTQEQLPAFLKKLSETSDGVSQRGEAEKPHSRLSDKALQFLVWTGAIDDKELIERMEQAEKDGTPMRDELFDRNMGNRVLGPERALMGGTDIVNQGIADKADARHGRFEESKDIWSKRLDARGYKGDQKKEFAKHYAISEELAGNALDDDIYERILNDSIIKVLQKKKEDMNAPKEKRNARSRETSLYGQDPQNTRGSLEKPIAAKKILEKGLKEKAAREKLIAMYQGTKLAPTERHEEKMKTFEEKYAEEYIYASEAARGDFILQQDDETIAQWIKTLQEDPEVDIKTELSPKMNLFEYLENQFEEGDLEGRNTELDILSGGQFSPIIDEVLMQTQDFLLRGKLGAERQSRYTQANSDALFSKVPKDTQKRYPEGLIAKHRVDVASTDGDHGGLKPLPRLAEEGDLMLGDLISNASFGQVFEVAARVHAGQRAAISELNKEKRGAHKGQAFIEPTAAFELMSADMENDKEAVPNAFAENFKAIQDLLGEKGIKVHKDLPPLTDTDFLKAVGLSFNQGVRGTDWEWMIPEEHKAKGLIPNFITSNIKKAGKWASGNILSPIAKAGEIMASKAAGYINPVKPQEVKTFTQPSGQKAIINSQENTFKVTKGDSGHVSKDFAIEPGPGSANTSFWREMNQKGLKPAAAGSVPSVPGGPSASGVDVSMPAIDAGAMQEAAELNKKSGEIALEAAKLNQKTAETMSGITTETMNKVAVDVTGLDMGGLAEQLKDSLADQIKKLIEDTLSKSLDYVNPFTNKPPTM